MKKRLIVSLVIGCILMFLAYLQPYKLVVVNGLSMWPTYKDRQILLAKKTTDYKKSDVVVAYSDDKQLIIKRIMYMPGEYYYYLIKKDGTCELILDNSYRSILKLKNIDNGFLLEERVPKDQFYIVGDNLGKSDDSRRFGSIEKSDILYKVIQ